MVSNINYLSWNSPPPPKKKQPISEVVGIEATPSLSQDVDLVKVMGFC